MTSRRLCGAPCAQVKKTFEKTHNCSKKKRFCQHYPIRTLGLWLECGGNNLSFEAFDQVAKSIQENEISINLKLLRDELPWPASAADFIARTLSLNQKLFQKVTILIPKLGRFRSVGEEVEVDVGKHQFAGEIADKIEESLAQLWANLQESIGKLQPDRNLLLTEDQVLDLSAYIMVHFFKVHPFNDGNGRVARILIRIFARRQGFDFDFDRKVRQSDKKYLDALREAHSFHRERNGRIGLKSCHRVALFLKLFMNPVHAYGEDEEPASN